MNPKPGVFEVQREGDTLILAPVADLDELGFQQIESSVGAVLDLLDDPSAKNVVLDFHRTDYFGTTALGWFLRLWKQVTSRNGRMALCNASEHEKEILRVTKLDRLWPICGSREEAMRAVRA